MTRSTSLAEIGGILRCEEGASAASRLRHSIAEQLDERPAPARDHRDACRQRFACNEAERFEADRRHDQHVERAQDGRLVGLANAPWKRMWSAPAALDASASR